MLLVSDDGLLLLLLVDDGLLLLFDASLLLLLPEAVVDQLCDTACTCREGRGRNRSAVSTRSTHHTGRFVFCVGFRFGEFGEVGFAEF